jgi:hypothetical protein
VSVLIEAGATYDQLRGVIVEGTARIIDDPAEPDYWAAAISHFERYNAPYTEDKRHLLEKMMHKRVVVRVDPNRVRSWDHRKLGGPAHPFAGTTAQVDEP